MCNADILMVRCCSWRRCSCLTASGLPWMTSSARRSAKKASRTRYEQAQASQLLGGLCRPVRQGVTFAIDGEAGSIARSSIRLTTICKSPAGQGGARFGAAAISQPYPGRPPLILPQHLRASAAQQQGRCVGVAFPVSVSNISQQPHSSSKSRLPCPSAALHQAACQAVWQAVSALQEAPAASQAAKRCASQAESDPSQAVRYSGTLMPVLVARNAASAQHEVRWTCLCGGHVCTLLCLERISGPLSTLLDFCRGASQVPALALAQLLKLSLFAVWPLLRECGTEVCRYCSRQARLAGAGAAERFGKRRRGWTNALVGVVAVLLSDCVLSAKVWVGSGVEINGIFSFWRICNACWLLPQRPSCSANQRRQSIVSAANSQHRSAHSQGCCW